MPAACRTDGDIAAGAVHLDDVHSPTPLCFLSVCASILYILMRSDILCDVSHKSHNSILSHIYDVTQRYLRMVYPAAKYEFCRLHCEYASYMSSFLGGWCTLAGSYKKVVFSPQKLKRIYVRSDDLSYCTLKCGVHFVLKDVLEIALCLLCFPGGAPQPRCPAVQ